MDNNDIPKRIQDRELFQITIKELFITEHNKKGYDYNIREDDTNIHEYKYYLPEHQRELAWNNSYDKQNNLVDSIFLNLSIGPIIVSQKIKNNNIQLAIEDGQNRLQVIQLFIDDGFEYKKKKFSQLTDSQRDRFQSYKLNIERLLPTSNKQEDIEKYNTLQFTRLQEGIRLKSNDKYWAIKEINPIIKFSENFIKTLNIKTLNKRDLYDLTINSKERQILENISSIICILITSTENIKYISSSYDKNISNLGEDINITENKKEIINKFFETYENILRNSIKDNKIITNSKFALSKAIPLYFILYEFKFINNNSLLNIDINNLEEKWILIWELSLKYPNFIYKKQILFQDLSDGNTRNVTIKDVKIKYEKINKFYIKYSESNDKKELMEKYI
jgi:hypothetical protein